jgi:hypothetical protein
LGYMGSVECVDFTMAFKHMRPMTRLEHVELFYVKALPEVFRQLIESCPGLKTLRISCSDGIDDHTLDAISKAGRTLRILSLRSCEGPNFTDEGIKRLAEACQQLEYLDISDRPEITDTMVKHIVEHCFANLKYVNHLPQHCSISII